MCCRIADPNGQQDVFERLKQAIKALDTKRADPYGHLIDYSSDIADWPKTMVEYAYNGEGRVKLTCQSSTSS